MGLVEGGKALITGAGSGIGRATALMLAAEGAAVAVCDLREDRVTDACTQIEASGGQAVPITADVRRPQDIEGAVDTAADAFGGLTILFNNAGISTISPLEEMIEDEWDAVVV